MPLGLISSIFGAREQKKGAQAAASAQVQAAQLGVDEQKRQFDIMKRALNPFVEAGQERLSDVGAFVDYGTPAADILQRYTQTGVPALEAQETLAGLRGPEEQAAAIEAIKAGPEYQAMAEAAEEGILRTASATGGLRGGRTQEALFSARPDLLSRLVERQYSRLGGLSGLGGTVAGNLLSSGQQAATNLAQIGQGSAAQVGAGALQTGRAVSDLMQQQGAAQAGLAKEMAKNRGELFSLGSDALMDIGKTYVDRGGKFSSLGKFGSYLAGGF